jgi:hypothetical protein
VLPPTLIQSQTNKPTAFTRLFRFKYSATRGSRAAVLTWRTTHLSLERETEGGLRIHSRAKERWTRPRPMSSQPPFLPQSRHNDWEYSLITKRVIVIDILIHFTS